MKNIKDFTIQISHFSFPNYFLQIIYSFLSFHIYEKPFHFPNFIS